MPNAARFQGDYVNDSRPEWSPLLAMVGHELTAWFMWMGELELDDGTRVHSYKHRSTRRYAHIGVDGRTFYYDWDGKSVGDDPVDYVEMSRTRAIDAVFRGWRQMLSPDDLDELWEIVDHARDVAAAGGTLEVDPKELELQRAYEARQDKAA